MFSFCSTEIPDFLTKEECEHIIRKATEAGLALSEVKLPDEKNTTDKFASEKLFNEGFPFFFNLFVQHVPQQTIETIFKVFVNWPV